MMEKGKRLSCRRVRDWLQEQHDREGPQASGLDRAAEAHLEGCPDCRRFREFLASYGRELAASLDALSGRPPMPDLAAAGPAGRAPGARRPAAQQADRAPEAGARRPAARWAVPAAAAALLAVAVGTQAPRLLAGARVEHRIRVQMTALVEELYSRPLAQGVEAGLIGGSLLEGLSAGDGLQDLGEGEGPVAPGGDFISP